MEGAGNPFIYDLFPLLMAAKDTVIDLALASARFAGLIIVVPVFKRTELGRIFLSVIAMGLALPISGALAGTIDTLPTDQMGFLVLLTIKEFLIGMLLGLLFGIPFWAIQAIGEFVDHQRTIGESGMFDPSTGAQGSVMSVLLTLVAITLFVVEGGLGLIAGTVYDSYQIWQLTLFLPDFDMASLGQLTSIIGRIMLFGLMVAAPLVLIFLASDFAVMGIGRTTARVDISYTLPLVKNLLFGLFSLLYLQFLVGYLQRGLTETRLVSEAFELIVGR